jgi:hypothetical protein
MATQHNILGRMVQELRYVHVNAQLTEQIELVMSRQIIHGLKARLPGGI